MADTERFNRGKFLSGLKEFTGTMTHYNYMLGYRLTDGAKYVADECEAYWLMDIVVSYYFDKRISGFRGIQYWTLEVDLEESSGIVKCFTDNEKVPAIVQKIPLTTFPIEKIQLYCQNKVIYLPREN